MLSERMITLISQRFRLLKLCGVTYFDWDLKQRKLKQAGTYMFYSMLYGTFVACFFPVFHLIQIWMKLHPFDDNDQNSDPDLFVKLVIAWGEVVIGIMIVFFNIVMYNRRYEIVFLFNQLIDYSTQLKEIIKRKNMELDQSHRRILRFGELTILFANFLSLVVPFGVLACLFHPLEPTHGLIKEWLEIDFKPELKNLPLIILFWSGVYTCTNMSIVLLYLATIYIQSTKIVLDDLTPQNLTKRQAGRVYLETKFYGELEDLEIVNMYRSIRMFNVLINDIMASAWIAFHHVACLTTFSALMFLVIKYNDVLFESGFKAIFIIGCCIITPTVIILAESSMFAELANLSDGFIEEGKNLAGRKSMYRKFVASCQTFYVEEAYPFYKIGTDTFLAFLSEGLDKSITLLLW